MLPTTPLPDVRLELESGYRFHVSFDGATGFITDEPPPLGAGAGPNPSALLAAAVGNCLASSLLFCLRKSRIEPAKLTVDAVATKGRDLNGRLRIERIDVRLVPVLASADAARIGRCLELFESFCIVTESVRRAFPVNVRVEPKTIEALTPEPSGSPPRERVIAEAASATR